MTYHTDLPIQSLSVVLPVYNDAGIVGSAIERIVAGLSAMPNLDWELVIVDDASCDETCSLIKAHEAFKSDRVRLLARVRNGGQHAAYYTGCKAARGRWYLTFDADYAEAITSIPRVLQTAADQSADLVSLSRFGQRTVAKHRQIGTRFLSRLTNRYTKQPMSDPLSPIKLVHQTIVTATQFYGEKRRFLAPLAISLAKNPAEIAVPLPAKRGRTHFSVFDLTGLSLDFLLNFFPGVFTRLLVISLLALLGSVCGGALYVILRMLGLIPPSVVFQVIDFAAIVASFNVLTLAVIGEYHLRTYRLVSETMTDAVVEVARNESQEPTCKMADSPPRSP